MTNELHLLIPGLLGPFAENALCPPLPRWPVVETCLARAERSEHHGRDFIETAYRLFDLALPEQADIPSAAISWLGEGGQPADTIWLHADPVYLRPDMDHLLLFDRRTLEIRPQEAQALVEVINRHFAEDGWQVHVSASGAWYLCLADMPEVRTHALYDVAGRNIYSFLPSGGQQRRWRSWLNELQMLLYQTEVNQQRREQGMPEINGLWLWGAGALSQRREQVWDRVYSSLPFIKGLARLNGSPCEDFSEDILAPELEGQCLMLLQRMLYPVMDGDKSVWAENVGALQPLFQDLQERLRRKSLDTLWIYPCNGLRYRVSVSSLRRFWRRPKPLESWLDVAD